MNSEEIRFHKIVINNVHLHTNQRPQVPSDPAENGNECPRIIRYNCKNLIGFSKVGRDPRMYP